MADFPNRIVPPLVISTFSRNAALHMGYQIATPSAAASMAWPAANQAIYVPVSIPFFFPVARIFFGNGATAGVNMDFGIYTLDGAKLYSTGTTAQNSTTDVQYVTPTTPFLLKPGQYFFALACSGTTAAGYGTVAITTTEGRLCGLLQQAVYPLPTTATFAQWASTGYPFCGITRK